MLVGFLLVAMVGGAVAFAATLGMGAPLGVALLIYPAFGSLTILLAAALVSIGDRRAARSAVPVAVEASAKAGFQPR